MQAGFDIEIGRKSAGDSDLGESAGKESGGRPFRFGLRLTGRVSRDRFVNDRQRRVDANLKCVFARLLQPGVLGRQLPHPLGLIDRSSPVPPSPVEGCRVRHLDQLARLWHRPALGNQYARLSQRVNDFLGRETLLRHLQVSVAPLSITSISARDPVNSLSTVIGALSHAHERWHTGSPGRAIAIPELAVLDCRLRLCEHEVHRWLPWGERGMSSKRVAIGVVWCVAATVTMSAQAAEHVNLGVDKGLWQSSSQMHYGGALAPLVPQMAQALARMPAAERARIEAAMHGTFATTGAGSVMTTVTKSCLIHRRLLLDFAAPPHRGTCQTTIDTNTGSRFGYHRVCTVPGGHRYSITVRFKRLDAHHVKGTVDVVTYMAANSNPMTVKATVNGKWLGASCAGVTGAPPAPHP